MSTENTINGAPVKVIRSPFGALTGRDFVKGAAMAAISAGLASIQQFIEYGDIFNMQSGKTVAMAAIGALVAYLIKNLASDTTTVKDIKPADAQTQ